jgi:hypothetical protein
VRVFVAAVRTVLCRAYGLEECAQEEEAYGWHASTDDADVDFDCGPHVGFNVVP